MNRLLFTFLLLSITYTQEDGEVVKNVTAAQRTDGSGILDITYELQENSSYTSYDIFFSIVNQEGDQIYLTDCTGDVWFSVNGDGTRFASCDMSDLNISDDFNINVHADGFYAEDLPDSFEFDNTFADPYCGLDGNISYFHDPFDCDWDHVDYNHCAVPFEMMKYEVTVLQYVDFLYSVINQAVENGSFVNNDNNGQQSRTYYLNNGDHVRFWSSDNNGFTINGYYPASMCYPGMVGGGAFVVCDSEQATWYENPTNTQDENDLYPRIEVSFSGDGPNDISFFVSPGLSDHPVVDITFEGALAFARHYGLRIPDVSELAQAAIMSNFFDEGTYQDGQFETILNSLEGGSCAMNVPNDFPCHGIDDNGEFIHKTRTVGLGYPAYNDYDIYDIIGNVSEYAHRNGIIYTMLPNYDQFFMTTDISLSYHLEYQDIIGPCQQTCGPNGGWDCWEAENVYLWYQIMNLSIEDGVVEDTWENHWPTVGFRCVRTVNN